MGCSHRTTSREWTEERQTSVSRLFVRNKWYEFFIFAAAFKEGFHLLVFIALVNTVVSLYYYLLIVKAMYITPRIAPLRRFAAAHRHV